MIRLLFTVIVLTVIFKTGFCQKPILTEGNYLIVYNSERGNTSNLTIKDTTFIEYTKTDTISGNIVWIDSSRFILKNNKERQPQTELEKALESLGDICFEIISNRNNEYKFRTTHVGQLHITVNIGTITRIDKIERIKNLPR